MPYLQVLCKRPAIRPTCNFAYMNTSAPSSWIIILGWLPKIHRQHPKCKLCHCSSSEDQLDWTRHGCSRDALRYRGRICNLRRRIPLCKLSKVGALSAFQSGYGVLPKGRLMLAFALPQLRRGVHLEHLSPSISKIIRHIPRFFSIKCRYFSYQS